MSRTNTAYAFHLRALRHAAGLTQTELAELVKINPVMISHLERLRRTIPMSIAVAVADALGVGIDVLIDRVPPEGPCHGFHATDLRPQPNDLRTLRQLPLNVRVPLTEAESARLAERLFAEAGVRSSPVLRGESTFGVEPDV